MIVKSRLFVMFAVVFGVSLVLLGFPTVASSLMASTRNVLSAFTAVFFHKDLAHLGSSVLLTLAVMLLYSVSNMISGRNSDNFFIVAIWIATVAASLAFVNLWPNARLGGSSGLVSAFIGGTVVTAYLNAWTETARSNKVFQAAVGTFLVVAFVILNLNVDSRTMVTVHLSAFLYMAVLVVTYRFLSSFFSKGE